MKKISAKVTTAFPGKPDDETQVRDVAVGEIIDGELAKVAIAQKWAEEVEAKSDPAAGEKKSARKGK